MCSLYINMLTFTKLVGTISALFMYNDSVGTQWSEPELEYYYYTQSRKALLLGSRWILKTISEKEKMLVANIFLFSQIFFYPKRISLFELYSKCVTRVFEIALELDMWNFVDIGQAQFLKELTLYQTTKF